MLLELIKHIYDGENGGWGLLIAFIILAESITRILIALINVRKPVCNCDKDGE